MTIENIEPMIPVKQNTKSATIEQIMEDNPDLSYELVRQLLIAQAEVATGRIESYEFGKI